MSVVQMNENSTKVDDDEFYDISSLYMLKNSPLVVEAKITGTDIKVEVDTGASRSIINMETYNTIKHKSDLLTYTNSKSRTYSGLYKGIFSTFSGKGKTPSLCIQNPKYVTLGCKNIHFLNFNLKSVDFSIGNTDFKFSKYSTLFLPEIKISCD